MLNNITQPRYRVTVYEGGQETERLLYADNEQKANEAGLREHRAEKGQPAPGDPFTVTSVLVQDDGND